MTTEHVKFSTASELLRENTFEAERLMELYTLADYKERQITRLRQEEKELNQIINDEKEIIASYDTNIGTSTEKFVEKISLNTFENSEINVTKSNSARGPYKKSESSKLTSSGSAANLIDELQHIFSNQPNLEGGTMSLDQNKTHSFAQSRQNFFTMPQVSTLLSNISDTKDFNIFFQQFPLSMILSTGFYENAFPIDQLAEMIENWSVPKRDNFFLAFFNDIHQCAILMNLVFHIAKTSSIFSLVNFCEKELPNYYNCKRVGFLFYDSPKEELIYMKEKIKIRYPVKQGIFMRSLISQSPIESSIEDSDVSQSDKIIFQQNKHVLIMPVLSAHSQFQVEGLLMIFDKIGETHPSDYFTASFIARSLAQVIPSLRILEENKERKIAYKNSVQNYVFLCTSSNLASLIENITSSFCSFFNCEAVRVFKVYHKTQTYREVTEHETFKNCFNFSAGIVGSCISNGTSINLTKPQFYDNYNPHTDCYDEDSFSSSLLVRTIIDSKSICRWAIVLYNKRECASFTELDAESLSTICHHLLPLLQNSWREKKLKQTIKRSKKQLLQAEALTDAIASLKSPIDIDSMLTRMNKFFKMNTEYTKVKLYILEKFRNELICYQETPVEIVSIHSDDPIAECARLSKFIQKPNEIDNTSILYYPVLNSSSSVVGVFKIQCENVVDSKKTTNTIVPSEQSHMSLLMLNTFRSSSRLLSLVNLETARNGDDKNDQNNENENVEHMLKMWQKVAGSIIEGMQKHLYYSKKKQLIDLMSTAIYLNQFDNSFKVWQEVQIIVDDFDNIDITSVNIDSPVITDLVFANSPELSEKTIQLIKTLQSLNSIDQSIFTEQAIKEVPSVDDVINEDGDFHCHPFVATSAINILEMDEGQIIENIISTFNQLAILQFFGISGDQLREFLIQLRSIHPANKFQGWKLAVDHFQFAAFLMLNSAFGKSMSDIEMISVLLFLLSLYSDAPTALGDLNPLKRTRFTLETSGMFSTISSFFTASACCKFHIFKSISDDDKLTIWNLLDDLDLSKNRDAFLNAAPSILICCVSRYSYMMRETGITIKWFNRKLEEEMPEEIMDDLDDVKEYFLSVEMDSVMQPMMEEAIKIDPNIKSLLDRYHSNVQSILKKQVDFF